MPTQAQLNADKAREAATTIKGDMPPRTAYVNEAEKWDEKGNLIDPEAVAYEQRQRDVLLGKVEPEESDYPSKEWAQKMMANAVSDPEAAKQVDAGPSDLSAGSLTPQNNPIPGESENNPILPAGSGIDQADKDESKTSKE